MTERGAAAEVILFDVGGVLVQLGPHPLPPDFDVPLARCFESRATADFERGFLSADEFAQAIIDEFGIDADAAILVEHFRLWPAAPFPGVIEMLARLRQHQRIAILSNTNELHWPRFEHEFGLFEHCDQAFGSHLLGMLKPEAEIFEHVIDALDTEPGSILFFDDNPANVAAAQAAGMQAELVRGFDAAIGVLSERGIAGADKPGAAAIGERGREDQGQAS